MSTRSIRIIMILGSKVRPVRRADNRTAICEIHNISQPYGPPRPVTGIALLFFLINGRNLSDGSSVVFVDSLVVELQF
jgi:hypothetical protein